MEPGDIFWIDFDPPVGREQAGRRPALVLSEPEFVRVSGFAFVAPITRRIRPFASSVVLPEGLAVAGEILVGQTRAIDVLARVHGPPIMRVPANTLEDVRAKLAVLLGVR